MIEYNTSKDTKRTLLSIPMIRPLICSLKQSLTDKPFDSSKQIY